MKPNSFWSRRIFGALVVLAVVIVSVPDASSAARTGKTSVTTVQSTASKGRPEVLFLHAGKGGRGNNAHKALSEELRRALLKLRSPEFDKIVKTFGGVILERDLSKLQSMLLKPSERAIEVNPKSPHTPLNLRWTLKRQELPNPVDNMPILVLNTEATFLEAGMPAADAERALYADLFLGLTHFNSYYPNRVSYLDPKRATEIDEVRRDNARFDAVLMVIKSNSRVGVLTKAISRLEALGALSNAMTKVLISYTDEIPDGPRIEPAPPTTYRLKSIHPDVLPIMRKHMSPLQVKVTQNAIQKGLTNRAEVRIEFEEYASAEGFEDFVKRFCNKLSQDTKRKLPDIKAHYVFKFHGDLMETLDMGQKELFADIRTRILSGEPYERVLKSKPELRAKIPEIRRAISEIFQEQRPELLEESPSEE